MHEVTDNKLEILFEWTMKVAGKILIWLCILTNEVIHIKIIIYFNTFINLYKFVNKVII